MPRDARLRVRDIAAALDRIRSAVEGLDLDAFVTDELRVRAVAFDFVVLGEAASRVPPEIQRRAPEIPWSVLKAMRNKLAHEYYSLSAIVLWETAV